MFRVKVMKIYRQVTGRGTRLLASCHMLHGGLTHSLNSGHRIVAGVDGTDGLAKYKHFYGNIICLLSKWKKTNRLILSSQSCTVTGSRTCSSFTFEQIVNRSNKRLCSSCNKQSFSSWYLYESVCHYTQYRSVLNSSGHTRSYNVLRLLLLYLLVELADPYICWFNVLYMIPIPSSSTAYWNVHQSIIILWRICIVHIGQYYLEFSWPKGINS